MGGFLPAKVVQRQEAMEGQAGGCPSAMAEKLDAESAGGAGRGRARIALVVALKSRTGAAHLMSSELVRLLGVAGIVLAIGACGDPARPGGTTRPQSSEERAGRLAVLIAQSAEERDGPDWRADFDRLDREVTYAYQETQMAPADFRRFKAAMEIVANPAELAKWQRRIGRIEFTPEQRRGHEAAKERFEQWKADYRERLRERRQRLLDRP